jgi:hypothetical protein
MPGFDSFAPPVAFAKHTPVSVEENTPNNLENDTRPNLASSNTTLHNPFYVTGGE